jgi:crossover junction endodeoxyribonuclease RuvC
LRVMGIDPGLTRCGVSVIEGAPGRTLSVHHLGVIRTPAAESVDRRLVLIASELDELLDRFVPDVVAIERVFSQHNVRSVMGTAQAAAVAMLLAGQRDIRVATHTPTEVKAAVTGSGRAGKAQVTAMVTRVLNLDEAPRPADAADAAAIAICQVWRGTAMRRLAEAAR